MADDKWVPRINAVIDSVRNDVAADHDLADLAARAHASPHHFHRRFRELTGETPLQFVRRSRLERAAYLMMASPDRTLTGIAHEVGFRDSTEFSRSFRRLHGIAPSKWDGRWHTTDATDLDSPDVRVVNRPALRLATVRARGIFGLDDLDESLSMLLDWMNERGLDPDRRQLFGMSFDNYETTPHAAVHYSFGLEVPDAIAASGEVHIRHLPAFTGASVSINGDLASIARAWDHIYHRWFPARPWSPASHPALKLFRQRPDQLGWSTFDLDCVVPFRIS